MTDEQIIKALPIVAYGGHSCNECKYSRIKDENRCGLKGCLITRNALDLINRLKAENEALINGQETLQNYIAEKNAEIERLHTLCKPTETSGYKIENGKVVFYTKILNGYRHEYESLDRVVNDMNIMLQNAYKTDEIAGHYKGKLKTAKSEAYKEFSAQAKALISKRFKKVIDEEDIDILEKRLVGDKKC